MSERGIQAGSQMLLSSVRSVHAKAVRWSASRDGGRVVTGASAGRRPPWHRASSGFLHSRSSLRWRWSRPAACRRPPRQSSRPQPPRPRRSSRGNRSSPGWSGSRISACCATPIRLPRRCCAPPRAISRSCMRHPRPPISLQLLGDPEGRVRRRAALALGRVHLAGGHSGVGGSTGQRQRARSSADGGVRARADRRRHGADAVADGAHRSRTHRAGACRGRRSLCIGDKSDAAAIGMMLQAQVKAGALNGIEPDDLDLSASAAARKPRDWRCMR